MSEQPFSPLEAATRIVAAALEKGPNALLSGTADEVGKKIASFFETVHKSADAAYRGKLGG